MGLGGFFAFVVGVFIPVMEDFFSYSGNRYMWTNTATFHGE
jgi:hypothetical protein